MTDVASGADERDHFIPVRKIDVIDAVIAHGGLATGAEQEQFRQLCRLLGAIYHYQYFDRLERLRSDYFYFDPTLEHPPRGLDGKALERAYQELIGTLETVLRNANFVGIAHEEIGRAHRAHTLVRVEVEAPLESYREVRFYRRGHHREKMEIAQWFGWRKHVVEIDVHDDVVLLVTMKESDGSAGGRHKRKPKVRPGAVLLKCFRDIAHSDLHALFPDVRVVMSMRDRLMLGIPALVGGIPVVIKLASTMTVLFLVASFYLGAVDSVHEADMAGAIAAISGLVALGGYILRQWTKFQRQTLLYQKMLSENVYFRNVNNNAGIFDFIIGEAEEQECKEAFLAYYFLLAPGDGPTAETLDRRIEQWLRTDLGADIDFECEDALAKLDRLGLLRRDGARLSVPPLGEALRRLDQVWDDFFPYAAAPGQPPSAAAG